MHQARQTLGNGQAESRAAVFACGRAVCLTEGIEDSRRRFRTESNSRIANFELESTLVAAPLLLTNRQLHFARLGELERIADEIRQHLAQPARVAIDVVRQVPRHVTD